MGYALRNITSSNCASYYQIATLTEEFRAQLEASVLCFPHPRASLFHATGKDSERYLNGRITQKIAQMQSGIGAKSLLLTPQGRIQGQFVISRAESGFLLLSDPLPAEDDEAQCVSALLRFRVADQVEVLNKTDAYVRFSLLGTGIDSLLESAGFKLPGQSLYSVHQHEHGALIRTSFGNVHGLELLLSKQSANFEKNFRFISELTQLSSDEFHFLRIGSCTPFFGIDLGEAIIGAELPNVSELVSFNKGCYAGQEVMEMATARGKPNKMLEVFFLPHDPEGSELVTQEVFASKDSKKSCGFLTSSARLCSSPGTLALGFLKSEVRAQENFYLNGEHIQRIAAIF